MWQVEKHCVVPEQLMDMLLNKEENIGLSLLQSDSWKRKFCAGSRLGAMFWNCDLIPTTTLFPRREARERETDSLTDEEEREWKPTSSLTDSYFYSPAALHEKNPIQKSAHTQTHTHILKKRTYKPQIQASLYECYTYEGFCWFHFQNIKTQIYPETNHCSFSKCNLIVFKLKQ